MNEEYTAHVAVQQLMLNHLAHALAASQPDPDAWVDWFERQLLFEAGRLELGGEVEGLVKRQVMEVCQLLREMLATS